ncbi:response regulator transcription factor [Sulfitobacter pseudonitzschiae]|uniref:Response regulator transcription factor n=1 Tax=Pseudosulfitobacter pseudonitzschiae TaxID=1402135 RepID=A0A9Q2NT15_9RHOB|nr:hypothetical protein [Pseudosulfitobacter pseudonitzschiae]MBM2293801.1 response regulator transcription factor [Pseudosulfitobacter pseudonitzschiae]MBM2298718.1 response regulator transcription factor [Pseudosulfitobacter pseudonitzschiae]MBM2303633.1 response regulator transcription factor [Pseudosulfitobacter pseudonitzschiae]MBM2313415.1 response regulator transcription factor [Pseudosulfitobacter pseudonitzschiae]MBM2318329.1 response regulator transcription factor [Pseudosulfitobacte
MSDKISDEALAAIDAFLAKNKPTKLPTGMTSHSGYVYVDGKLVLKDQKDNPNAKGHWQRKAGSISPSVAERRQRLRDYMTKGMSALECAQSENVPVRTIYNDAKAIGRPFGDVIKEIPKTKTQALPAPSKPIPTEPAEVATSPMPKVRKSRASKRVAIRREEVAKLVAEGMDRKSMAKRFNVTPATISADMTKLGIKTREQGTFDKSALKRDKANANTIAKVADRRRFKAAPVPFGTPSKLAPDTAKRTIFPDRVLPVGDEDVLKDGSNNSKIGGDVLLGWLQGARIYTLTIEERATCPTSCSLWSACYGNSMQFARRWEHGQPLMDKIEAELDTLLGLYERILVRLHVLGDFWSVEYATFWRQMLARHRGLHVFGFTAHKPGSSIGTVIRETRAAHPTRYMIRHSDMTGPMGSFTLDFPTEMKTIGDAVVCPEQVDGMKNHPESRHCGNCAVCWSSDRPVAFVVH